MTLKLGNINFDTTDPLPIAKWWAKAIDGEITEENDGYFVVVKTKQGFNLAFQQVEYPTSGKNRIHLDFGSSDPAADLEQLLASGASHVADHNMGDFEWKVLADPEGNLFCIASAE